MTGALAALQESFALRRLFERLIDVASIAGPNSVPLGDHAHITHRDDSVGREFTPPATRLADIMRDPWDRRTKVNGP
jgi:hypothetical protein